LDFLVPLQAKQKKNIILLNQNKWIFNHCMKISVKNMLTGLVEVQQQQQVVELQASLPQVPAQNRNINILLNPIEIFS
jgi:hypothetical protein